jgi:nitroimidazol reductase NimA-like FMN-containing flavoprotein (pyridoxamine 5'-phosphate oxidase superfamily)
MRIREMTLSECYAALKGASIGRLACAHEGQPYIVPIFFVYDGAHLYGSCIYFFSTIGLKIDWMRSNPLVCLEVDDLKSPTDWTSVLVFGHYQELPETSEFELTRHHAHELLSKRASWWEPGAVRGVHGDGIEVLPSPIYFRIVIHHVTGRQGMPGQE